MGDKNFYKVQHEATGDPRFTLMAASSQLLYFHLCRLRNRSKFKIPSRPGWIRCSDKALQFEINLSTKTIWKARHELDMNGFINFKTTKNRTACQYFVIDVPTRNVKSTLPENGGNP